MKKIFIIFFTFFLVTTFSQIKNKTNNNDELKIINKFYIDSTYNDIIFYKDKFIAYSNKKIFCVNQQNEIEWTKQLNDSLISNVIAVDDKLVFLNSNDDLFTINLRNGKTIQSIGLDINSKAFIYEFDFNGDKELLIPKETDSKKALLLIFDNGTLLCLDLETLQEYWRKSSNEIFTSKPLFINNKFLLITKSGIINYFDSNNGLLMWKWKESENSQIKNNLLLSDDKSVYLISNESYLLSINLLLGKLNWKIDKYKFSTLIQLSKDKKTLYAQNGKNNILLISLLDGKVLTEIKSNILKSPIKYGFIYKNQNYLIISNKIYKIDKYLIKLVFTNEYDFEKLISIDNEKIVFIDSNKNIITIK